jgi:hypothetical protein
VNKFLGGLWALSPIYARTSIDGYFGQKDEYRINLINLLLGEINIQLVSKQFWKKDQWKLTKLSNSAQFILSDEKENEILHDYREHVSNINKEDRIIEKEELLRKLAGEQNRIDTSLNKINTFTAVFSMVTPLAIAAVDLKVVLNQCVLQWIVCLCLMYALINLAAFLLQTLNVRNIWLSSFSDIKKSNDKEKEQILWIYYDWQQIKRKADLFISYVSYVQNWTVGAMGIFFVYKLLLFGA